MTRSLTEYDAHFPDYERPQQKWICGRAKQGCPCSIGPSARGECQVHLECVPRFHEGRWYCTRPKSVGGFCTDGPLPGGQCPHVSLPCQPVRSYLALRRVVTMLLIFAAVGLVFVLISGKPNKAVISPGALASVHHNLEQNCQQCHRTGDEAKLYASNSASRIQSEKCLTCHQLNEFALHPHNLDPEVRTALTEKIASSPHVPDKPNWLVLAARDQNRAQSDDLACHLCHQEHQGMTHNLSQLTNQQCQLCHTKIFHNFETNHPEFEHYPYESRTRIYFNHATHYEVHFNNYKRVMPTGQAPQSCQHCHTADSAEERMLTRGFEHSCGNCHGSVLQREQIISGIELFRFPKLDQKAVQWNRPVVSQWMHFFPDGYKPLENNPNAILPPLMRLMLSHDDEFLSAQEALVNLQLSDLSDSTDQQKKTVETYLTRIHNLLDNLTNESNNNLQQHLQHAWQGERKWTQIDALSGPRSPAADFLSAIRLANAYRKAKKDDQILQKLKPLQKQGWQIDEKNLAVQYYPAGHADPLLRNLLELCTSELSRRNRSQASTSKQKWEHAAWQDLFNQLADPSAPGNCFKCHTIDHTDRGELKINWQGLRPKSFQKRITEFSHAPHLSHKQLTDCNSCHILDHAEENLSFQKPEYIKPDGSLNYSSNQPLASGFLVMQREQCAKCHTKSLHGNSCQQCHNYHVGHFPPPPTQPSSDQDR